MCDAVTMQSPPFWEKRVWEIIGHGMLWAAAIMRSFEDDSANSDRATPCNFRSILDLTCRINTSNQDTFMCGYATKAPRPNSDGCKKWKKMSKDLTEPVNTTENYRN